MPPPHGSGSHACLRNAHQGRDETLGELQRLDDELPCPRKGLSTVTDAGPTPDAASRASLAFRQADVGSIRRTSSGAEPTEARESSPLARHPAVTPDLDTRQPGRMPAWRRLRCKSMMNKPS